MVSHFVPLLQNEIAKAARRKLSHFGFFIVGLVCVIIYFIAGINGAAAATNAWAYLGFSMQIIYSHIGPIFVVTFAAKLLSDETGTGTIHAILASPVYRWELYLAKAAAGCLYMAALSLVALLFSLSLASIHYQFGPVSDAAGIIYGRNQALHEFLLSYALSWLPWTAFVMYGLLISTLIRSPGAAVSVAISLMVVLDFTKNLLGLDPYLFTRYTDYSWLVLQQLAQGMDFQWRPEVWKMAGLCGVSATVAFFAGLAVFVRQDLNH